MLRAVFVNPGRAELSAQARLQVAGAGLLAGLGHARGSSPRGASSVSTVSLVGPPHVTLSVLLAASPATG